MKTGIVVHGCHLGAVGWENLVWGIAPHQMGRLPKAIQILAQLGASVVYFGTGASEKDGKLEGQYAFDTLFARKSELAHFEALQHVMHLGIDIHLTPDGPVIYTGTQAKVVIDTYTQNTVEELIGAAEAFIANDVGQIVLISSATHMPRCLKEAQRVYNDPKYENRYKRFAQNLLVAPADTCFDGATYADPVIIEPAHRGDDDSTYSRAELAKLLFRIKGRQLSSFKPEMEELISRFTGQ